MYKFIYLVAATVILGACSSPSSTDTACSGNVSDQYHGSWYSIYSVQEKTIDKCTILTIDGSSTETQLIISDLNPDNSSDNTSDVWIRRPSKPSTVRYRISAPYRSKHNNVNGCASGITGGCSGNTDLFNLDTNTNYNTTTPTINLNEEVTIDDVPPGEYILTATVSDDTNTAEISDTVIINNVDTQLGIFNVVESYEHNFKSEIFLDQNFAFGDYTSSSGTLSIKNIGSSNAYIKSYNFDDSNSYIAKSSFSAEPGTILPGESVSIPFTISFKYLDSTYQDIPVAINITDNNNDIWGLSAYFRVYKNRINIRATSRGKHSIASNGRIRGYLITDHLDYVPVYSSDFTESIPYQPNKELYFILSSNDLTREITYSLGINSEPLNQTLLASTPTLVADTSSSIETSTPIDIGSITTAFLFINDIDSYTLTVPDDPRLHRAVSPVYASHEIYDGIYSDTVGDNNNILQRGETAYISLALKNLGTSDSAQITIELSTTDPNVIISNLSGTSGIQNRTVQLNGIETRDTNGSNDWSSTHNNYLYPYQGFKITVNPELPLDQSEIPVTITATEADRNTVYTDSFTIPLQ